MPSSPVFPVPAAPSGGCRLPLLDALRACASMLILWHHFALYPPLRVWAGPLAGPALNWCEHYARATQVFFVIGGYVLARSMAKRRWNINAWWSFLGERYCRLGLPYLAVVLAILPLYAFARGWLPSSVTGSPVTLPQFLAHLFFLQGILGYEQLSAGIWFVCINFQIGLVYAATLVLRDMLPARAPDASLVIGWVLSAFSLFRLNLDAANDAWAYYFYPYFFTGVLVYHATLPGRGRLAFWLYQVMTVAALVYSWHWLDHWRWRLLGAAVAGEIMVLALNSGFAGRWPRSRMVTWLGRIAYSLFLVHFPVLVFVSTVWVRCGWDSPRAALTGLCVACALSIGVAAGFHRWIEKPAAALAGRFRRRGETGPTGP